VTAERDVVEARKAQALRDLVEVERQRQAGEIDGETAEHLTRIYEAEVVAARARAEAPSGRLSLGWIVTLARHPRRHVAARVRSWPPSSHSDQRAGQCSRPCRPPGGGRGPSTVTDEEMEAVIAENPSVTPMRLSLIERYLREGNLEKAKEHAQLALDNDPSAADREQALKYLGWTTAALGDPHGGADLLNQSIALDPTDLDAKWFLANVELTQLDDPSAAATLLREILAQPISDTQRTSVEAKLKEAEQAS
jgi:tetratricopeptide (TPR) repeat protein